MPHFDRDAVMNFYPPAPSPTDYVWGRDHSGVWHATYELTAVVQDQAWCGRCAVAGSALAPPQGDDVCDQCRLHVTRYIMEKNWNDPTN